MALREIRPMIWTKELKETVVFYTEKLGFTCGEYNKFCGWAAFHRDNIEIMAALPNEHFSFERPVFTGAFYIYTDQVDKIWEELHGKVQICYAIENFEYRMREFAIFDNNGYILQFGQKLSDV